MITDDRRSGTTIRATPQPTRHGNVPLDKVHYDTAFQVRERSREYVSGLIETDPMLWAPIAVMQFGEYFHVIDGHHRVDAARLLKLPSIKAAVYDTDSATTLLAYELNSQHGQPLSLAARKEFARQLKKQNPRATNTELAARTGLNRMTIPSALSQDAAIQPKVGEYTKPVVKGPKRNDPAYWESRISGGVFAYGRKRGSKKERAARIDRTRLRANTYTLLRTRRWNAAQRIAVADAVMEAAGTIAQAARDYKGGKHE